MSAFPANWIFVAFLALPFNATHLRHSHFVGNFLPEDMDSPNSNVNSNAGRAHSSTLRSNASSVFYYSGGQRRRSRPFTYGFGVGGGRKRSKGVQKWVLDQLEDWLRNLGTKADNLGMGEKVWWRKGIFFHLPHSSSE